MTMTSTYWASGTEVEREERRTATQAVLESGRRVSLTSGLERGTREDFGGGRLWHLVSEEQALEIRKRAGDLVAEHAKREVARLERLKETVLLLEAGEWVDLDEDMNVRAVKFELVDGTPAMIIFTPVLYGIDFVTQQPEIHVHWQAVWQGETDRYPRLQHSGSAVGTTISEALATSVVHWGGR